MQSDSAERQCKATVPARGMKSSTFLSHEVGGHTFLSLSFSFSLSLPLHLLHHGFGSCHAPLRVNEERPAVSPRHVLLDRYPDLLPLLRRSKVRRVDAPLPLVVVRAQDSYVLDRLPEPVVVAVAEQSVVLEDAVEQERVEVGDVIGD